MFPRYLVLPLFLFISVRSAQAQYLGKKETASLQKHVEFLASDKLEGREPGTMGEVMAANYIVSAWEKSNIKPGGQDGTWFKPFTFTDRVEADATTELKINEKAFSLNDNFWPMGFSGEGSVTAPTVYVKYGITNPEKGYDDYANFKDEFLRGRIFVIELSSPDGIHPHSAHIQYSDPGTKLRKAVEKGAIGVIFVDTKKDVDIPSQRLSKNVRSESIPAVFLQSDDATQTLASEKQAGVSMHVKINRIQGNGKNVVGFIDNGAATNVIIGAHYDHLGWGDDGSLYKGEKAIHNGADDNASGTAALIEIGKYLAKNGPKGNNYILIAFSAEEKGLLGSNDYVKSNLFDPSKANYMINMDMVGRLEDSLIAISGAGTSSMWGNNLNMVKAGSLRMKLSESGVGPSDHTSFYLKDIPVLHFFTGTHSDYHKPSDDADKINYDGMTRVSNFIIELIGLLDKQGKLDFVKTKENDNSKAPKFSVTLGIVPDYMYDGEGVRADGITEGKAASKAGLKAGDILLKLGDYPIRDMQTYMEALGKFKKGDATQLEIKRGAEMVKIQVQF